MIVKVYKVNSVVYELVWVDLKKVIAISDVKQDKSFKLYFESMSWDVIPHDNNTYAEILTKWQTCHVK